MCKKMARKLQIELIYDDLIGYFIKIKKVVVTWTSQAVPHLSTNHA